MESPLLATKLRIPPQTRQLVARPQLVETLEDGIPNHKLALLATPAGYGKTTLLAQWAQASRLRVVWLSLDAEDNDFERLFRYLFTAWETAQPGLLETPLGLLLGAMSPDRDAVLTAFMNVANDLPDHTVFVLDDAHLLVDDTIQAALTFVLDHLPPTLHFVLAGRGEPPLPLARYRARQELLELAAEELRFSVEEADELLNGQLGLGLSDDEVVQLQSKLEGWATALQLVALTLQRRATALDTPAVSGQHRFIADYLREEVLARLPEDIRRFLLQTSILEQVSGPLCDAVTARDDSQAMLERLERENLFLVPLDDNREWYRYQRLFADVLQAELGRRHDGDVTELHRRAAGWYFDNDLPEAAVRHAVQSDDAALVLRMFDRYFYVKLLAGEIRIVFQWLASLPEHWFALRPELGLFQTGPLIGTGQLDASWRHLDEVEQRLVSADAPDAHRRLAEVTALRCIVACYQNDLPLAERNAERALRNLPEDALIFRPGVHGALGDTYRRNGYWKEAHTSYLSALGYPQSPAAGFQSAHAFGALADLELRQGHLRAASGYWHRALGAVQEGANWGLIPLPVSGWVFVRLGELLYERNELPPAWDFVTRGLERAELGGDVRALFAGNLIAGRLKLTEGELGAATEYLERAHPLLEQAAFPDWSGRFERLQLELWLAQDKLRAAVNWADTILTEDASISPAEDASMQLAIARVLLVKDDAASIGRAQVLLATLLQAAEAEGRMGIQIETLTLQSLANWRRGEQAEALTALERALRLAEPEGYVRLFADLGLPMARLLQEARARAVLPDYVATLLAACGSGISSDATERALPEPLTTRELEILNLLAAGLTNREIGNRLFISPQTVKKHAGSIYDKLGVRSRTQAVARAREFDLLS